MTSIIFFFTLIPHKQLFIKGDLYFERKTILILNKKIYNNNKLILFTG